MWLVLLFAVAAAVYFYSLQKKVPKRQRVREKAAVKKPRAGSSKKVQESTSNQYHAISICCEEHACAAALANQDKRYLVADVPTLPLSGCAAGQCNCRYEHHDDRRSDEGDRRLSFGLSQDLHGVSSAERRECRDRRKSK